MDDRVPEYEPDDAAAQRIAEDFADAAAEYATEEARDDAAEAWCGAWYERGEGDRGRPGWAEV